MGILTTAKDVSKNKLCYTLENQQKSHFMSLFWLKELACHFWQINKLQWFCIKGKAKIDLAMKNMLMKKFLRWVIKIKIFIIIFCFILYWKNTNWNAKCFSRIKGWCAMFLSKSSLFPSLHFADEIIPENYISEDFIWYPTTKVSFVLR